MGDNSNKIMKYAYLAGIIGAFPMLLKHELGWASGLMIGVIWSVFNFNLTENLFAMALLQKDPKRLTRTLMIKFPALYVGGFFVLKSRLFPVMSILAGIGLALIVIGVVYIWPKRA